MHVAQNELFEGGYPSLKTRQIIREANKLINLHHTLPQVVITISIETDSTYKHWFIVEEHDMLKMMFPNKPFLSFNRHRNIQDHLHKRIF